MMSGVQPTAKPEHSEEDRLGQVGQALGGVKMASDCYMFYSLQHKHLAFSPLPPQATSTCYLNLKRKVTERDRSETLVSIAISLDRDRCSIVDRDPRAGGSAFKRHKCESTGTDRRPGTI
jgi:hypothetical protein